MSTASDFVAAAQAVAAALLASSIDPADGVRLLSSLAAFAPSGATPASVVGQSMMTMQGACGDLFRRTTVIAMCRAAAQYQPSSADDAVALRESVVELLDAEILIAGDQGEDNTFNELRALRAAVVKDLQTRAAGLPGLITVSTTGSVPAPVLALRLYGDPTRADELATESGAPHPGFLAPGFKALSS